MITFPEIVSGVYGAWRLARRDPGGMAFVNDSVEGFRRSFWAAVLVAPGFLALEALGGTFEHGLWRPLLVQTIAYVIGWVAFPLAMAHICEGLERGHAYLRYIAVYNWSAVVQMALYLPAAVLTRLFPDPGLAVMGMMVTIILLVYQAYVAHVALQVGPGPAAGIVVFDLLLGGLVQMTADRLMG